MVEAVSQAKFKFCYIMRGMPGSGKSTIAKQLAGTTGVILTLETSVVRNAIKGQSTSDGFEETLDKHFKEFCDELEKATPIIVVDNVNIRESEYLHFIEEAQKMHYFVSVVSTPPPASLELAAERSTIDITAVDLHKLTHMYEPLSLERLAKKTT